MGNCFEGWAEPGRARAPAPHNLKLLLGRFAFHRSYPICAILRKLVFHGVRGRRKDLHGVAAFHGRTTHLFVAAPDPGVAINGASGVSSFSDAAERMSVVQVTKVDIA